jgi:hypothetical protein
MSNARATVNAAVPPSEIHFVVPRKYQILIKPDGTRYRIWLESEEEWALKCGMVRGLK